MTAYVDPLDERQQRRARALDIAARLLTGSTAAGLGTARPGVSDPAALLRVAEWILDEHDVAEAPEGLTPGGLVDAVIEATTARGHTVTRVSVAALDAPTSLRAVEVTCYPGLTPLDAERLLGDLGVEEVTTTFHGRWGSLSGESADLSAEVHLTVARDEPTVAPVSPETPTLAEDATGGEV